MDEEAKAIQEIAKSTGKAIDGVTKAGKFISQYLNGSLIEAFGIFQDKLKYIRWERQVRLWDRATEFLHQRGLEKPNQPVPMSIAIPILQYGSMEEDNSLQDLWAALLANAADAGSGITVEPAFIGILQNLSARDAIVLDKLYFVPEEDKDMALYMHELLAEVSRRKPEGN